MTAADVPTVSIVMPVLNESAMLRACLESIADQDYERVIEVLIADGGSTDETRDIARQFPKVVVLDNPRVSRPAGLNVAIAHASGEVIVRVDARTRLQTDYVSRCVAALTESGAAVVGGPMRFTSRTSRERGIAAAMMSRLGAGPAEFRRIGGKPRFVDTVYLGAFRRDTVLALGGYDERSGGNEDAELAYRARPLGGVLLDPSIISSYSVRDGLGPLARQFYRYGRNRARTIRKHPRAISPRQLAVPGLFAGLLSPWRRGVLLAYAVAVAGRGTIELVRDPAAAPTLVMALPTMHTAWGFGFMRGLLFPRGGERRATMMMEDEKEIRLFAGPPTELQQEGAG